MTLAYIKILSMKTDPRIRRTRERLHQTLLQLSLENGYDQVTVQDILQRSETARSTFYAHFQDKDDLLLTGLQETNPPLFAVAPDPHQEPIKHFTDTLFSHIDANKTIARVFFGSSAGPIMMGHLRNLIVVEARQLLSSRALDLPSDIPAEMLVQYIASASFGLLSWWVDRDFCPTAMQMSAHCSSLIRCGLFATPGKS